MCVHRVCKVTKITSNSVYFETFSEGRPPDDSDQGFAISGLEVSGFARTK